MKIVKLLFVGVILMACDRLPDIRSNARMAYHFDEPAILWEESSIVYNGSSYTPFVAGQKYIDAGQPANPTIIHKNTSISKEVYSSEQVKYSDDYYVKGWYTTRIDSPKTALVFCVVREDSKKYIT